MVVPWDGTIPIFPMNNGISQWFWTLLKWQCKVPNFLGFEVHPSHSHSGWGLARGETAVFGACSPVKCSIVYQCNSTLLSLFEEYPMWSKPKDYVYLEHHWFEQPPHRLSSCISDDLFAKRSCELHFHSYHEGPSTNNMEELKSSATRCFPFVQVSCEELKSARANLKAALVADKKDLSNSFLTNSKCQRSTSVIVISEWSFYNCSTWICPHFLMLVAPNINRNPVMFDIHLFLMETKWIFICVFYAFSNPCKGGSTRYHSLKPSNGSQVVKSNFVKKKRIASIGGIFFGRVWSSFPFFSGFVHCPDYLRTCGKCKGFDH